MYAMKLNPAVKDYIWGGDNLKKYWNKKSDKVLKGFPLRQLILLILEKTEILLHFYQYIQDE